MGFLKDNKSLLRFKIRGPLLTFCSTLEYRLEFNHRWIVTSLITGNNYEFFFKFKILKKFLDMII